MIDADAIGGSMPIFTSELDKMKSKVIKDDDGDADFEDIAMPDGYESSEEEKEDYRFIYSITRPRTFTCTTRLFLARTPSASSGLTTGRTSRPISSLWAASCPRLRSGTSIPRLVSRQPFSAALEKARLSRALKTHTPKPCSVFL